MTYFIFVTMGSPKWLGCIKAGHSWISFLFCGMLGPIISFQPPQFDCEMALCYWDAIILMPLYWQQFARKKIGNQAVVEMISPWLGDSLFSSAAAMDSWTPAKLNLLDIWTFAQCWFYLVGINILIIQAIIPDIVEFNMARKILEYVVTHQEASP